MPFEESDRQSNWQALETDSDGMDQRSSGFAWLDCQGSWDHASESSFAVLSLVES
jgi:hypothetical protein